MSNSKLFKRFDGTQVWLRKNLYHREDGPAIIKPDGTKEWYQNDLCHRIDGPAVEQSNGTKIWYQNNLCHRIDGPACERADGRKEWYVNGTNITDWVTEQGISDNPTKEEQLIICLAWC